MRDRRGRLEVYTVEMFWRGKCQIKRNGGEQGEAGHV